MSLCFCLSHHTSDTAMDGSILGRKWAGNLTLYCKLHKRKKKKNNAMEREKERCFRARILE